ncbi:PSD1 and planctomycete cytochrome C domain-containing protein [Cyclobacterium marinum]|uniref:PSD1 and planctomycete cytochrome C domain-containing protein n=1 Tax=Cyclobacterium marinum TaxID=104 RepID=UPI0011EC968B|nr:PSD1 and planctomycete cytochrome C domain-containing protein [Cyclobacterium marinum]MBI0400494.1 PSD1 domain-containing protein [Cyclobacterium marinum]
MISIKGNKMFWGIPFIGWLILVAVTIACKENPSHDVFEFPDQVSYNLHVRPILSENCFTCHGPDANKREAGLRLDVASEAYAVLKDSPGKHAIVPGSSTESLVFNRMISLDPEEKMPPPSSNLQLSDHQVNIIKKWIDEGAVYEPHWAFVSPKKTPLPKVKNKGWAKNEIDYFVLSKMEAKGLSPSVMADDLSLMRRIYFDLIGLPPSPEVLDELQENGLKPEAVIDRLFKSASYGEKMAVAWMDVARYADSHGYQDDYYRTQWPWRDWVIHAFNKNMPYDQFITWQLAGDLLPNAGKEQLLATGFNRNHKITEESGAIDEEYRVMYAMDRTNTLGKAMLGVTLECAQCHDHKYDPISQKEYFQTYAFFNTIAEWGIEEKNPGFSKKSPAKYPLMEISNKDVEELLQFINMPDSAARVNRLMAGMTKGTNYNSLLDEANVLKVAVMGELDSTRNTYILERGAYDAHGEKVEPGLPASILPFPDSLPQNRLGLAKWLFDKENPLPARVFVNRIWQELFGVGIVDTPGDFGLQGNLPTNQELLDWLAVDFIEHGWNIQYLLKKIMLSSTYQQSSIVRKEHLMLDPENKYLARFPRLRLKAEEIRDLILASSGLLNMEIGGPSVKTYQPAGLWEAATSGRGNLSKFQLDTGKYLYRRGLYTFIKRTVPPPSMMLFDASNRDACEVERLKTSTPLQALVMMNDPVVLEASRVFASQLLKEDPNPEKGIGYAFYSIIGRKPDEIESKILGNHLTSFLGEYREDRAKAKRIIEVGKYPIMDDLPVAKLAALAQVITLIYNMEASITKA